jgi:hypothetical protein
MNERDDFDLRERFAHLRDRERACAPDFDRVVARAGVARGPRASWAYVAAAALVVAAVALVVLRRIEMPAQRTESSLARWSAPTDFLLRTPGHELLSTSPALVSFNPLRSSP